MPAQVLFVIKLFPEDSRLPIPPKYEGSSREDVQKQGGEPCILSSGGHNRSFGLRASLTSCVSWAHSGHEDRSQIRHCPLFSKIQGLSSTTTSRSGGGNGWEQGTQNRFSLSGSSDCPGTRYVDPVGLEITDPPVSRTKGMYYHT